LLLHIFQHRDPNLSAALYHPEDRWFLCRQRPASTRPFEPIAPGFSTLDTVRSALMPGNHIHFITLHLASQAHRGAPLDDAATQQTGHLLDITVVEIQFVGDLPIGQIFKPIRYKHRIHTRKG
jgi:hypothetical protein